MVEINSNVNSMDQAVIKMFTVNVKTNNMKLDNNIITTTAMH